jgi:hypothetical protein
MKGALAGRIRKITGSEAPPTGEDGGLVGKLAALKAAETERARCAEVVEVRESRLREHMARMESMAPEPRRCPHCGAVIQPRRCSHCGGVID